MVGILRFVTGDCTSSPCGVAMLAEFSRVSSSLNLFALGGQTGEITATCLLASDTLLSTTTDGITLSRLLLQRSVD